MHRNACRKVAEGLAASGADPQLLETMRTLMVDGVAVSYSQDRMWAFQAAQLSSRPRAVEIWRSAAAELQAVSSGDIQELAREIFAVPFAHISGQQRGRRAIPKAACRLCPDPEKFPPFRSRPRIGCSVATCAFLKAATCSRGAGQLKMGRSCRSPRPVQRQVNRQNDAHRTVRWTRTAAITGPSAGCRQFASSRYSQPLRCRRSDLVNT